jgi:replicative DNA helicase
MSSEQLVHRLLSIHSQIPGEKFTRGKLTEDEEKFVYDNSEALVKAPIHIDDTPAISLFEMRAKAFRLKNDKGIQLIIVDYLQLMSGAGDEGNREQEVSNISKGLKRLSRELEIPVIALSQLSRQVENRPGGSKKPQLSDLRESGSQEQDADLVFFLFRPEYYGMEEYELNGVMVDARELAEFIVAKNRHGETGPVPLKFSGQCMDFSDYDMSKLGITVTKSDVNAYLKSTGQLEDGKKDSTFVQEPKNEFKQETLTNNEDFLNQTSQENESTEQHD